MSRPLRSLSTIRCRAAIKLGSSVAKIDEESKGKKEQINKKIVLALRQSIIYRFVSPNGTEGLKKINKPKTNFIKF
jgi:hypothetical protein